jgi:hypothetical protein
MSDILIELHANDPARNRRRAWRVVVGADLFGLLTAQASFRRIGAAGRTMRHEFTNVRGGGYPVRSARPASAVEASPAAARLLALTGLRRAAAGPLSMSNWGDDC